MSSFFINRPIVAMVIAILTVLGGLIAMRGLPPDVVRETFIVEDLHFLLPASLLAHLVHVYRRCVVTPVLSSQLVQERHGFLEVRRVKPLGEPAIDRREELVGFGPFALLLPQAGQAHGSP